MSTSNRFERKTSAHAQNSDAKGYYNLAVVMKDGTERKLGGIVDNSKLSDRERQMLMVIEQLTEKQVTMRVSYNSFEKKELETLTGDDF